MNKQLMVNCIVCRKPLADSLRRLNMEFHSGECAKKVIKQGWHFISKLKDEHFPKVRNSIYKEIKKV